MQPLICLRYFAFCKHHDDEKRRPGTPSRSPTSIRCLEVSSASFGTFVFSYVNAPDMVSAISHVLAGLSEHREAAFSYWTADGKEERKATA